MRYAIHDIAGRIYYIVESNHVPIAGPWRSATQVEAHVSDDTHYIEGGVAIEYPALTKERFRTGNLPGFSWNPSQGEWVDEREIETIRSALLNGIRRKRDSLIEGGFVWDGSPFDSDTAISQPRLLGLFTTAIAGGVPPEGYPWRLADNSWRVLSTMDAQLVWGTFQTHMASHFSAFAIHENAINALTDIPSLQAYDITTGWPS